MVEFKCERLENGLTVLAEVIESARSVALGFFVRTGSRDEWSAVSGVSHFLEHMLFKGTDRRSALEVNLEFDQMGAKYNAFTSEENTVYYAAVLPEYQGRALALWSDLMRPALREDDFSTEKGVICEEIAMYKDHPQFDVIDRCRRLHFGEHGCGNSVLGTVESIGALKRDEMVEYFSRRYGPENMVLASTGKVDWEGLVKQAEELCGQWEESEAGRALGDFRGTGASEAVQKAEAVREHLCLMAAAPPAQDERRYAAGVLANVVGDDTGSRLYWALVDTALADGAGMDYDQMDGTGLYYTYVSCDPGQADKVLGVVRHCYEEVGREGVTDKELEASKNKIASMVTLQGELPMGRLVPLGLGWTYREAYCSLAEEMEAIRAVSSEDIRALLEEYPLDKVTTVGLGPVEKLK